MDIFSFFIFFLGSLKSAWNYADVPGVKACFNLYPLHGFANQDPSTSPYRIYFDEDFVHTNDVIKVTINGTQPFKGFLIEARTKLSSIELQGRFLNTEDAVNMHCGHGRENAAGHFNNEFKDQVVIQWTPLKIIPESIKFYATVVYNFSTFWTGISSRRLDVGSTLTGEQLTDLLENMPD
ncbi:putative defense protein [Lycorma delicatula]|uniref:putative defense protein n=1 Tax=Lycorma delicatula TaxID=130591 RepID=UPI003F5137C2